MVTFTATSTSASGIPLVPPSVFRIQTPSDIASTSETSATADSLSPTGIAFIFTFEIPSFHTATPFLFWATFIPFAIFPTIAFVAIATFIT